MEQINIYDACQFLQHTQVTGKQRVCAIRVSTQHEQQTNALNNQNQ
ncbi:hypothetical protein SAMN02745136_05718 [Anaerocolumna jejuensis DSM 15929]|uniref:Uncharacterized protein n=1 Tax=Anaerocolumna jejuensis DSM 15929 TaxID=1121322 RepID=A0A1M7DK38_9FIRM|nr:hypothetical protein [Anaerocolumna jejuensis]SHL79768.1 hypothetical protein SAMN02745136_05718 [Anaerocolumna jejuensis DSM 15929]